MLFAQPDQITLADKGLSPGVDVHIDAQLFALTDNVVDLIKAQIQLVAVFRRPAAGTVEVAGRGRVQQDGPGNVAAILPPRLLLGAPANQVRVDEEIDADGLDHILVNIAEQVQHILVIGMIRIFDNFPQDRPLGRKFSFCKFVRPIHQLQQILLRIFIKIAERLLQAQLFDRR